MPFEIDSIKHTIRLLYQHSVRTEYLLTSYGIVSLLTIISPLLPINQNLARLVFTFPALYVFLIARLDRGQPFNTFYKVLGIGGVVQIVAKILYIQLLVNSYLIGLLASSIFLDSPSGLLISTELSLTALTYAVLALYYRTYRWPVVLLGIALIPCSCLLTVGGMVPLCIFNSNCLILIFLIISEQYED